MAASKLINKKLFDCACNISVSKMSADGHQIRTGDFSSDKKAMQTVHTKMIAGAGGIIGGAYLMRVNPLLGLACMIFGAIATNDVAKDYKTGKKHFDSIK